MPIVDKFLGFGVSNEIKIFHREKIDWEGNSRGSKGLVVDSTYPIGPRKGRSVTVFTWNQANALMDWEETGKMHHSTLTSFIENHAFMEEKDDKASLTPRGKAIADSLKKWFRINGRDDKDLRKLYAKQKIKK